MNLRIMFATSLRVFRQLSHDHRTLALLFVMPCVLLGLLAWLFSDSPAMFNKIGAPLLGVFPFVIMFLVTSITTLRERRSGTLERLLTMPMGKLDFLLGYALTFGLIAIVQALLASYVSLGLLGLDVAGPEWFLVVVALVDALLGTAVGLLVSAFARTEFQAVQFLPALILPQFLLCGLILPLDKMPDILVTIAYALPLTYAVEAMNQVTSEVDLTSVAINDVGIIAAFCVGAIILGAATLRRKTT